MKLFFKRILCIVGIHWEGWRGLGMYGDASRCAVCKTDAYDILVLNQLDNPDHENPITFDQWVRWVEKFLLVVGLSVAVLLIVFITIKKMHHV